MGNIPYDASESDLYDALASYWNVDGDGVDGRVQSVRIVRDWRTGGYGFLQFYDAMAATSAMEGSTGSGGGPRIGGRRIRFDQGRR